MPILGGRENVIIDWDDTLLAEGGGEVSLGGNNNVSDYVTRLEYNYGLGVINAPNHFTPTMLRGRIRLNRDLDHIPLSQLDRPHYMRHIVDGRVLMQCIAHPVRNRTLRLSSPNTALLRERVDKSSVEPRWDYWLWDEVLAQVGAARGPVAIFNGYDLHGGLRVRTTLANFLRQMMTFGGGYTFEDQWMRLNFMAARGGSLRNWQELVSEQSNDTFQLDISPKSGVVRNEARASIVRVNPFGRKLIRSYDLTLATNGVSQLFTAVPAGEIGGQWSVVVSAPNPAPATVRVTVERQDGDGVNFSVFNAGGDAVAVTVEVYATTYNVLENENVSALNVESSILYGRQPLERFPDWGASTRPINEELERLRRPLLVCKLRMPIVPEVLETGQASETGNPIRWLHFDVGTLMRMRDGEREVVMMIGRKHVNSREIIELEWDLVEFPIGRSAYERGWHIDDNNYTLGVDTYIRGEAGSQWNAIGYNGQEIERRGMPILREPLNPIMWNSKFIKRRGGFISREARIAV